MAAGEAGGKRERTRAMILLCSAQQFAKHGYNGVSMDLLAKAAKLTKGALYDHFNGKDDVYVQSTSTYLEAALNKIKPVSEENELSTEEALFSYLGKFLDLIQGDLVLRGLMLRLVTESTSKTVQEIARKALTEPFNYAVDLLASCRPELDAQEYVYSFYCNAILREDLKNIMGVLSPSKSSHSTVSAVLSHFRKTLA
ncbi:TetR/AcrR family transcriptional regulator [Zhongshania guokunii]|uniref:TetR/AcrR family transcriptional regulator n=1 Tax=Zhongshania guokunii TaxID=641783 RepID=A0ABV3UCR7_9GAMM